MSFVLKCTLYVLGLYIDMYMSALQEVTHTECSLLVQSARHGSIVSVYMYVLFAHSSESRLCHHRTRIMRYTCVTIKFARGLEFVYLWSVQHQCYFLSMLFLSCTTYTCLVKHLISLSLEINAGREIVNIKQKIQRITLLSNATLLHHRQESSLGSGRLQAWPETGS